MQSFEGERIFALPPDQLWPKLRDAAFLAVRSGRLAVRRGDARSRGLHRSSRLLVYARQPRYGHRILGGQEAKTLRIRKRAKASALASEVETALTFEPHEGGTKMLWTAEVKNMGGLLKMVPSGLIRGAAHKVIEDVWSGGGGEVAISSSLLRLRVRMWRCASISRKRPTCTPHIPFRPITLPRFSASISRPSPRKCGTRDIHQMPAGR